MARNAGAVVVFKERSKLRGTPERNMVTVVACLWGSQGKSGQSTCSGGDWERVEWRLVVGGDSSPMLEKLESLKEFTAKT